MSQENVEVIRASFEFWRDGRTGEWIETLDADIEWDISAHPLPDFPDRGRGRDAFVGHMGDYLSGWTAYEASGKELIDRGDDVVLIIHERARMPDSDMMLDRDLPSVWTVRDERAVRLRVFRTRSGALEAIGLSEEAMPHENVELLRRMFELFSKRELDWDALFELLGPDIVWEVRSDFPDAAVYTGHEGIRSLSDAFDEAVGETWYRPLEYIHIGSRVVVPLRWGGLGMGSGAAFAEREETWVFTLRGGRIRHVKEYGTKQDALDAVGLRD